MEQFNQDDHWLAERAGARPVEGIDDNLDALRSGIESYPAEPGSWEAACLKSVADLLDGLEKVRLDRDETARRLTALQSEVIELKEERDRVQQDLEDRNREGPAAVALQAERDELLRSLEEAVAERDAARVVAEERAAETQALREQVAALVDIRDRLADMEREREEWDAALEKVQEHQAELEETKEQLALAERERDALAENVHDVEARKERAVEAIQNELEELRRAREESLVEACDLRVQANRLENDLEEERKNRQRKVKKILAKIHGELDAAGAPRGEDLSFGERIRWLKQQIDGV